MQQNCIIKKIDLSYQEPSAIKKPWATSVDAQGSFQKRIHNESNGLNSKEKFRLFICLHPSGPKIDKKAEVQKKTTKKKSLYSKKNILIHAYAIFSCKIWK